ncbi:DEK protein, partial [Fregetta grallaria]|nr:DEK protein [Fregetta grallaria]
MSSVVSSKEDTMSSEKADEKQPETENKAEESDEDEEEEEEEEEEEKEKSLIVEGKREKKKVDRLTMQVSSLQKEPFTITPGKLVLSHKNCEVVLVQIHASYNVSDYGCKCSACLNGKERSVASLKKNVGQFSGFPFEKGSDQYKKKEEMLKKFRNAMLKSICEVLDLERSGVNSELVTRILNFLMHPKSSGKPLPKSKKTPSKGGKKERSSAGTTRKAKRTKCPEILSDESSSEEDEKKEKDDSSEEKESEDEPPRKASKREKSKKTTSKTKKAVKGANVKKADSSTTKKNQNSSRKESESEDSSDDEPLIKKLKKPPTDEELKETVKNLLANANLEEVTMKQICKEV